MINNERGITLIEILIAMFLIGVGLVGLMVVVPVAASGVQSGSHASAATYLAQQRIEQARNARWAVVPAIDCLGASATPTSVPVPTGATCNGSNAATFPDEGKGTITGFTDYARTTRITVCTGGAECDGISDPALRLVTVIVAYRPVTSVGVGATDATVVLNWLAAQR
jgi:type II secretory pathway pseudopilin PulG